jgi:hypothetical protein
MMKRSMFLAAGLIASLAFTASSQAGTVYDATSFVTVYKSTADSATVTFVGGPLTGPVTISPGTGLTITGETVSAESVKFTFNTVGVGSYALDFTVTAGPDLTLTGGTVAGTSKTQGGVTGFVTSVPEPASMALLGIGMTSFLAFRRFFNKRNPVA